MAKATTKYQELKAKMAEARKQLKETARKAFTEMAEELFAENPSILSFGWTQYTPYWNDGDVCEFGANTDYPSVSFTAKDGKVVNYNENSGDCTDGDDTELDSTPYEKEFNKHLKAISAFLNNFDEEDLEAMFGDHMQITVDRKGKVETEEYEHE